MNNFDELTAKLAFQADRKILELEEEDHYRVDFPAQGNLNLSPLFEAKSTSQGSITQFAMTAIALFIFLFTLTNMQSYSMIVSANLSKLFSKPVEITELAPSYVQQEAGLTTEFSSSNDGILPIPVSPTPYENRVSIPSIGVDAPIVIPEKGLDALKGQDWNALEREIKEALKRGVTHYPGTAEPGQEGNVFLTGHSSNVFWEKSDYNSVFALLPTIEVGADIFISFEQEEYHYRVTEKKEVSPKDISVLEQGKRHVLSLMTCTPVGTRLNRTIILAEQVR